MRRETNSEESGVVETNLRVRYSETDQMGIVYHAHYLVWFEIGRTEWCRAAGVPYAAMERAGLFIPVTRVDCAFRGRASYDDPVTVQTRMTELGSRGCTFAYEVTGAERQRLADGATKHVFTDAAGRVIRGSEATLRVLEAFRRRTL